MTSARLPFDGVRVLSCSQYIASSYAASFLGQLGAEVIKVEGPSRPDPGRLNVSNPGSTGGFPDNEPGSDWWNRNCFFHAVNGGQNAITIDLTKQEGRVLFRDLATKCDILIESYRPSVMARWNLDYSSLSGVNPRLIMASVSGFGHTEGPYREYPATATVMEATDGHAHVTGFPDHPPSKVGLAFVDFVATWSVVMAVAAALRRRMATETGEYIDVALYECGVYLLQEYLLDWQINRDAGSRIGNRHRWALQGCYPALGVDEWVVIAIENDEDWAALCEAMGRESLRTDRTFWSAPDRLRNQDRVDAVIEEWTRHRDKYEIFHTLQGRKICCAPVLDASELHRDPHLLDAGMFDLTMCDDDPDSIRRPLLSHPWRYSAFEPREHGRAPRFGEHSAEIFETLLGLNPDEIRLLEQDGITGINTRALNPPPMLSADEMIAQGRIAGFDPRYRDSFLLIDP